MLYRDSEHDGDPAEPVLGIQEREEHFPAIQSAAGHDQGGLWNIWYLVNIENDPVSLNDLNDSDDPVSSDSEPGREQVVPPVSSPHPGKISIYL